MGLSILLPNDVSSQIVVPRPDARRVFEEMARANPKARIEFTEEGQIIVMAPAGIEGDHQNLEVAAQLLYWTKQTGKGFAFGPSAGFDLPSGANRSPDAAWVSNERMNAVPREQRKFFFPGPPDFAIEVKSPSDSLSELQEKCRQYIQNGVSEAWLIDAEHRTVYVYTVSGTRVLGDITEIAAGGGLQGFVLDLRPVWKGLGD
jgi:Uma2 family endonuclease